MRRYHNEPSEEDLYLTTYELQQKYKHLNPQELIQLQKRIWYFRT